MRNYSLQRTVTGVILLLVMCVPSFVPALHEILHTHRHHHCNVVDGTAHFHSDVFSCDLCDYLTSFTYLCDQSEGVIAKIIPGDATVLLLSDPISHEVHGLQFLRGPPGLS